MPYLPYDVQDPRLKQPTLGEALAQGTGATAPIGVAGGGSSAGQVGPQPTPAGGGSGFVNLSQYLGANQGAAQQMGQNVASQITAPIAAETAVSRQSQPNVAHLYSQPYDPYAPAYTDAQKAQAQGTLEQMKTANDPRSVGALLPEGGTEGSRGLDAYLLGAGGMSPISNAWNANAGKLQNVAGYNAPVRPEPKTPGPFDHPNAPAAPWAPVEPLPDYQPTVSGLRMPKEKKVV